MHHNFHVDNMLLAFRVILPKGRDGFRRHGNAVVVGVLLSDGPWVDGELDLSLLGVAVEDVEVDGDCPALILGSVQNSVYSEKSAHFVHPDIDAPRVKRKSKGPPVDISIPGVGRDTN